MSSVDVNIGDVVSGKLGHGCLITNKDDVSYANSKYNTIIITNDYRIIDEQALSMVPIIIIFRAKIL